MNYILYGILPVKLISLAAYGESSGEGTEAMKAVINVIQNRTKNLTFFGDKSISNKYRSVILKKNQFSAFNPTDPVYPKLLYIAQHWNTEIKKNKALQTSYRLAQSAIRGALSDITRGSVYYHRYDYNPSWSKNMVAVKRIGSHIFYRKPGMDVSLLSMFNPVTILISSFLIAFGYWIVSRRENNGK